MRKYACPLLHILTYENHSPREIYCKQCNKWIAKVDTYTFQWHKKNQRYYLSGVGLRPKAQDTYKAQKQRAYKRRWYQKNKERHKAVCAVYRAKRKALLPPLEVAPNVSQ